MKFQSPEVSVLFPFPNDLLERIELVGRVCYKSEDRITGESAKNFVRTLIKNGHESVLEHFSMTVRFVTDRGVSHEIVRHRIAAYSQESTRYCNYAGCVTYSDIPDLHNEGATRLVSWVYVVIERVYKALIKLGVSPQMARMVLPNGLKTEVIATYNLRIWRHFFRLRCSKKAHPQMRQLACSLLVFLNKQFPVVFEDILDGLPEDLDYKSVRVYCGGRP